MRLVSLAVLTALSTAACIMPGKSVHSGAVATGQPLAVVDDVKVWTETHKEKVGETEYKDADGNLVGTGAVYADKTETHAMKIWYPVQGTEQLSDEDFFRIAGDQAALDQTLSMRKSGETWHKRGLYAMVGGGVAVVASWFIDNAAAKTVLGVGGGLTVLGGYYASWWGASQMNPETHAVDRSVADQAAQRYNAGLGHTVGLSLGKSF
jgi:hypothetical protein